MEGVSGPNRTVVALFFVAVVGATAIGYWLTQRTRPMADRSVRIPDR